VSGKYEMFQRGVPFLAVRQAVECFVELVSTPHATEKGKTGQRQLQKGWETTFRQQLDPFCCEIMMNFVPSLRRILATCRSTSASSTSSVRFTAFHPSNATEARFQTTVTKFFRAIASRGPLTLFVRPFSVLFRSPFTRSPSLP
jgi:predicted ATPase